MTSRQLQGDGIDQHLAYIQGGTALWYLTDHLGSTRATINNSATVQDSLTYDAYGNMTQSSACARPLYTWDGYDYDTATALYLDKARVYDSATGRWITQDPMGFDAGDSNLYRYVNNRPTAATDPSGLQFGLQMPGLQTDRSRELAKQIDQAEERDYNIVRAPGRITSFVRPDNAQYNAFLNPIVPPRVAPIKNKLKWQVLKLDAYVSPLFGTVDSVERICRQVGQFYLQYGIATSWDIRAFPARKGLWESVNTDDQEFADLIVKKFGNANTKIPTLFFVNQVFSNQFPELRGGTPTGFPWGIRIS